MNESAPEQGSSVGLWLALALAALACGAAAWLVAALLAGKVLG